MRDLPSGTVTFLFTDVEGSTKLLQNLGAARYAGALAEHRRGLREAFAAHGGVEIDSQGDAFFVAFAEAGEALAAAEAARRTLEAGPLRVRIGVHTGEALLADEGYVGFEVHRAARIAAAGHGGQVVVSEAARLASGWELQPLGTHRLKDLTAPEPLWQLGEGEFPPLASLNQTNLPVQPSPLVGRRRELEELRELVERRRLVTLVGPGGSGKTRLAVQLAAELVDVFPHGVWWVPLQALRDDALVLPTVASTVGAQGELVDHLAGKHVLLLLDNMEQVIDAAGELAALLAAATEVALLVTSREPLKIAGEVAYPVDPLPEDDALALFRERAVSSEPEAVVRELCRRLDHLPLAIELAAARTTLLPPEQLLARLSQRLPLLAGGYRDAPHRQRTLRATIEWSHDLLSDDEKRLFAQLAAFAGSFDVEAAIAICETDLDELQSLVEKNLLRRWGSGRLGMLETIHEFAAELLNRRFDADLIRRRHGDWYLARAEETGPAPRDWLWISAVAVAWFDAEHENVRAALEGFRRRADAESELRLALATQAYWNRGGHWREGLARHEGVLERALDASPDLRAWAASGTCIFAWRLGDYARAMLAAREMLALLDEVDAPAADRFWPVFGLGSCESTLGNFSEAAADFYGQAMGLAREAKDDRLVGLVLNGLGNLALNQRDWTRARGHLEESLVIARASGTPWEVANTLVDLSYATLADDSIEGVAARLHESLAISRAEGIAEQTLWGLEGLAAVAAAHGKAVAAARLLGAATRLRDETGVGDIYPIGDEIRARTLASVHGHLDESAFRDASASGAALTLDAAAGEAALVDRS